MDGQLEAARASGWAARALVALPDVLLRALGGAPPPEAHGLAPDMWLLARLSARAGRPKGSLPVERERALADVQAMPLTVPPRAPVTAHDRTLAGIRIRTYTPTPGSGPHTPHPTKGSGPPIPHSAGNLVFFHGGGWVQRTIETHDAGCRWIAHLAGVRVFSVDYRRAPEHRFPAAADDALAAYEQIAAEHPGERIAVGGDSAGANLALATALTATRAPDFLWLLYPAADLVDKRASVHTFSTGFSLTEASMDWYIDQYVPDRAQRADPRASPLRADLSGMPPAYVATCLPDPLRDEGEELARRLPRAVCERHPLLHGFLNMTASRHARAGVASACGALRQGLHQG